MIKGNALLALSPSATAASQAAPATIVTPSISPRSISPDILIAKLNDEVQKIISAGHLRPGWISSGAIDGQARVVCGGDLIDYFHNPADTLWALSVAMPYLNPALAQSTKAYLQSEYSAYNPTSISHIGWKTGASREAYDMPADDVADTANYGPSQWYGDSEFLAGVRHVLRPIPFTLCGSMPRRSA